ncbi:ArsR/SmtB family transcription factor [Marinicella gelatinilytica]|uniref:ArsR/SmtB family transcription factor n=1 Tax=Marinicella gelatinilytica TaxID=2996017 RepID=UPI002260DAAB|nr:metalloregulator ArsR/SmtB family transcription factor [Marinicella gelatinilytica]MCX7543815.1 metalloregulator ArsR/SmtB family transcription factor [Marinicella gelatinilytica]
MELNELFKVLADESRIRLLLMLQDNELTVAEISEITQMPQPRVSTHLSLLRQNDLVIVRKQGVFAYYRINAGTFAQKYPEFLSLLDNHYDNNPLVAQDQKRLKQVLSQQAKGNQWVDSVAGDMERHYSPGRTWEATTRLIAQMIALDNVLDIGSGDGVLAELMAPQSKQYTCVDNNHKAMVAAKKRLHHLDNVQFAEADMHQLPFQDNAFDCVLLLQVLTYAENPKKTISEAVRVTKPKGRIMLATLNKHAHQHVQKEYGHIHMGFKTETIESYFKQQNCQSVHARITSQEQRLPHFEIITAEAIK